MKRNLFLLPAVVVGLMMFAGSATAQIPGLISYQGVDPSNTSTNITVIATMYDAATGGASVWSETQTVATDAQGMYMMILGSTGTAPALGGLNWNQPYWLELDINGTVLANRVQLTTSPYAFQAGMANSVADGSIGPDALITDGTAPADGQVLSFDAAGGGFKWIAAGSGGGSGAIDAIVAGNGISVTGGNGPTATISIANQGITGNMIANGTINTNQLAPGAVASSQIASNAVITQHIGPQQVTLPKINSQGASSGEAIMFDGVQLIFGNPTPGGPAGGELSGTYPNPIVADNVIDGANVIDESLTGADILNESIGVDDIGPDAVGTSEIINESILAEDIATGAVTTDEILNETILAEDIATGAVTTDEILNETILSEDIANNTILPDDIANGPINTVLITNGPPVAGVSDVEWRKIYSELIEDETIRAEDIATGAVTTDEILNETILSEDIMDGQVMTVDLADAAVTNIKLALNSVESDNIVNETILAEDIATGAVTTSEILNETILAEDIATGAVTTDEILNNTILNEDLATGAVDSRVILDDAVTSVDIQNETITAADIATGAVTTDEILDNTILNADMSTGSVDSRVILDESITSNDILNETIVAADIATGAVTTDEILDLTILNGDISTGAINSRTIENETVESADILNETIVAADIATGAVTTDEILNATILEEDIAPSGPINPAGTDFLQTNGVTVFWGPPAFGSIPPSAITPGTPDDVLTTNALGTTAEWDKIETANIDDLQITNAKIAADAVTTDKVLDGTLLNSDINPAPGLPGQVLKVNPAGTLVIWDNDGLTLPFSGTDAGGVGWAFEAIKTGALEGGIRGAVDNAANPQAGVMGETNGTGPGVRGLATGAGIGGEFESQGAGAAMTVNAAGAGNGIEVDAAAGNGIEVDAAVGNGIVVTNNAAGGTGVVVDASAGGIGVDVDGNDAAAAALDVLQAGDADAVFALANGAGFAVNAENDGGAGGAGNFTTTNAGNAAEVLTATSNGPIPAGNGVFRAVLTDGAGGGWAGVFDASASGAGNGVLVETDDAGDALAVQIERGGLAMAYRVANANYTVELDDIVVYVADNGVAGPGNTYTITLPGGAADGQVIWILNGDADALVPVGPIATGTPSVSTNRGASYIYSGDAGAWLQASGL